MTGAVWRPTFIDIEPEFNKFVPNFRNGKLVRDLVPDQPDMALNADYYFPDDHVIAELKCMEHILTTARLKSFMRPSVLCAGTAIPKGSHCV